LAEDESAILSRCKEAELKLNYKTQKHNWLFIKLSHI